MTEDLQDFIQNLNEEVVVMTTEATKMEKQLGENEKLVNRFGIFKRFKYKKHVIRVNRNKYKFLSLLFLKSKP